MNPERRSPWKKVPGKRGSLSKESALGHLENVNTFCDNPEQAMAHLVKNYSPSNICNLIVKRSLFFCQNKKVQIIQ